MTVFLVTGGSGFIGSNFIRRRLRLDADCRVVNFDLLTYAGNPENLRDIESDPRYVFVRGDIADADAVAALFARHKPDIVVNFAAESHNSRAILDPAAFYRTNTLGAQTLLEAARRHKISRFHHVSTCEVFGDLALDSPESFREDSPYRPRTPYNASKAAADWAVRAYINTFSLPATISICANNYGPRQHPEKLIPRFVSALLSGEKITLYQSSRHKREWLHVEDHCAAIDAVLARGREGETYNIGAGFEADIEEIAARLLAIFDADESRKIYVPDRPGHDRRYLLDSAKIRRDLQWNPEIEFADGLASAVDWYRQNPQWWRPLLEGGVDETAWSAKS